MKTKCCQYEIDNQRPVVMWNEFNGVVQCHNCGHVYEPKQGPKDVAARREFFAATMLGSLCSNPKLLTVRKTGNGLTDAERKEIANRKAKRAVEYADALIAVLEQGQGS